jgi:hypothetical protein
MPEIAVPLSFRRTATGAVHPADAIATDGRRSTTQPGALRLGTALRSASSGFDLKSVMPNLRRCVVARRIGLCVSLLPGSIAVVRCFQGISPKHCTSPARRAEGSGEMLHFQITRTRRRHGSTNMPKPRLAILGRGDETARRAPRARSASLRSCQQDTLHQSKPTTSGSWFCKIRPLSSSLERLTE